MDISLSLSLYIYIYIYIRVVCRDAVCMLVGGRSVDGRSTGWSAGRSVGVWLVGACAVGMRSMGRCAVGRPDGRWDGVAVGRSVGPT